MIKHKKIIFLLTFLFLFSCNKNIENKTEENLKNNVISDNLNSLEEEKTQSWTTAPETHITLPSEDKMKMIRQRFLLRTIIQDGDNYMDANQYILALNKYKKVLEQNPWDLQVLKKIVWVYTELKQFKYLGSAGKLAWYGDHRFSLMLYIKKSSFSSDPLTDNILSSSSTVNVDIPTIFGLVAKISLDISDRLILKNSEDISVFSRQ